MTEIHSLGKSDHVYTLVIGPVISLRAEFLHLSTSRIMGWILLFCFGVEGCRCILGYLATFLVSTQQMPVTNPPQMRHPKTSPIYCERLYLEVREVRKLLLVDNHWLTASVESHICGSS